MTSRVDRRHRIQQYTVPQVRSALDNAVFGEDNRRILYDLFLNNMTYEDVAYDEGMSVRGLQYKVDRIVKPVEDYLKHLN